MLAEVNALARQGRDIISFCIGQPDFPAPQHVQEAAIRAIKGGKHGYTPSAGIDELREAAAKYLARMRGGLPIRAQDVVVGAGAKPAHQNRAPSAAVNQRPSTARTVTFPASVQFTPSAEM